MDEQNKGIAGFFNGVKAEYRKIIWPKKEAVKKETVAVVVCALAIGIMIAIMDFFLKIGLDHIMNLH